VESVRSRWLAGALGLVAALAAAGAARAVELRPGDILVTDTTHKAIVYIDPATGARTHLTSPEVGRGHPFGFNSDLELDGHGALLVTDLNRRTIFHVDPVSGDRVPVTLRDKHSETRLDSVRSIVRAPDGTFVLGRSGRSGQLMRLDPATGALMTLSSAGRGTGPGMVNPIGVGFEPGGTIAVADSKVGILRVDPKTGNRQIVSSREVGTGPRLLEPYDIAVAPDGQLFVPDRKRAAIFRVDPTTGARVLVSAATRGGGPMFDQPFGVALEADGTLLVSDRILRSVFRVDPQTGQRTVIASAEVGTGPALGATRRVTVVPLDAEGGSALGMGLSPTQQRSAVLAAGALVAALVTVWALRRRPR
jgi:streptogramin lyase